MPFTDPQPLVPFQNTGLKVLDTNNSHSLIFKVGSDLTAERTLSVVTGDSDRTLTISGNPTLGDWLDQDVKTTASPWFTALGLLEASPVTIFEITHSAPYITLHNDTKEDGNYGREGELLWRGEQTGGEESILAKIQAAHDGASDDQKGIFTIHVNTGSDGTSPTAVLTIDSALRMALGTTDTADVDTGNIFGGANTNTKLKLYDATGSKFTTILLQGAGGAKLQLATAAGATFAEIAANNTGILSLDSVTASTGIVQIRTNSGSGPAARVYITNAGNVGINTSGADRKLEILDTANPQARFTHTDGTYYCDFQAESDGDLSIEPSGSNINIVDKNLLFGTTTGTEIGTAANQKIGFYGTTPVVQLAKANYNNWTAFGDVVDALVAIGLFDAS